MQEPRIPARQVPRRRFNMADGVIVTAAVAATLAVLRDNREWPKVLFMTNGIRFYASLPPFVWLAFRATYVLIPWTVAVFLMRLRLPRPRLRRLVLQPGAAACGAATIWLAFKLALLGLLTVGIHERPWVISSYTHDWESPLSWGAAAVAGAWLVLVLSGRWRPDRSWLDRLGRAIGVSWLALETINSFRILF